MLEKLQTFKLNREQEEGCRQFYLQTDIKQTRAGLLLIAIPFFAFIFNDYHFLEFSWMFFELLALRIGLILSCVWMFVLIGKVKSYREYDKIITLGSVGLIIGAGSINLTRPENFIAQVILTSMYVFIVYLVIPNRFLNKIILSSSMTIGELAVVAIFLKPAMPVFYTVVVSLFFANVIAVFSAWQLVTYRRKSYQDLVKRQELQEELKQHLKQLEQTVTERTEKLKEAERLAAIGLTAAMLGHDIRNPLMAVTASVYLAKKTAKNFPDGEAKLDLDKNLELISEQTMYMDKIVADLQDYAAPLHPKIEETSLNQLAQSVLSFLIVPNEVSVECQIDADFPKIKTDAVYIKRILTNLSNNGIQAMPQGGILTIRAADQPNRVIITVEDTGVGIAEDVKPKLFKPLVTTKAKGQGFGLAVVKRLTEALGGKVTYESEVGAGSKFVVELPKQTRTQ